MEAILAFFAARSLLQLMRLRMDHYRLVGQNGRIAAVLVAAVAVAPLAALSPRVASLLHGPAAASAVAHLVTAAQPAASSQVTLSTCANVVGRCGCAPRTAFHRGETVGLLAVSPATPALKVQVEASGQPATRVNLSNWRSSGLKHCAAGQYRVPAGAPEGFAHLHVVVAPGAPDQAGLETGFAVLP